MVHFMPDPTGNTDCETPDGKDNPRSHAVFRAREAIIDFACNARASSARCAEARAYLAEQEGDMDGAPNLKFRFEDRAGLQCSRCFAGIWLSGF